MINVEILHTEFEKYYAENIAAIIINNGGKAHVSEILNSNGTIESNELQKILVFPSRYITYHSISSNAFVVKQQLIDIAQSYNCMCIDYSAVDDFCKKQLCESVADDVKSYFNSFKKISIDELCLDDFFHKKIGLLNGINLSSVWLNSRDPLEDAVTTFKPNKTFYLNQSFTYYDLVFALEDIDICIANYEIDESSTIVQVCNYLNKPIVTSNLKYTNMNNIDGQFIQYILEGNAIPDGRLSTLFNTDIIDRKKLKETFLNLLQ